MKRFLKTKAEISLNVWADAYSGEIEIISDPDFEKECQRRLKESYSESEIRVMQSEKAEDISFKPKSQIEILEDLIEHIFSTGNYGYKVWFFSKQCS